MANPVDPSKFHQDMPPKGGFPRVRYKQIAVRRGPPGIFIVGGAVALTLYGIYNHVQRKHEERFEKLQDFSGRYERGYLIQARETVDAARLKAKLFDQEREVMKNVPGWTAGKNTFYTQPNKPRVVLRGNLGGES